MEHYFTNNKNIKEEIREINVKIKETELTFYTDNGVFNKKGLDYGTRLLIENLDFNNKNTFLDVGSGCGPIGLYISKQSENYTVDMIDVNDRAINLVKKAIEKNSVSNITVYKSNVYEKVFNKYDMILTNPPIHAGKNVVYDIIGNAYKYLNKNGELWIVIRKDQGAKSLMKDFSDRYNFEVIKKDKGFYIIKAKIIEKNNQIEKSVNKFDIYYIL